MTASPGKKLGREGLKFLLAFPPKNCFCLLRFTGSCKLPPPLLGPSSGRYKRRSRRQIIRTLSVSASFRFEEGDSSLFSPFNGPYDGRRPICPAPIFGMPEWVFLASLFLREPKIPTDRAISTPRNNGRFLAGSARRTSSSRFSWSIVSRFRLLQITHRPTSPLFSLWGLRLTDRIFCLPPYGLRFSDRFDSLQVREESLMTLWDCLPDSDYCLTD